MLRLPVPSVLGFLGAPHVLLQYGMAMGAGLLLGHFFMVAYSTGAKRRVEVTLFFSLITKVTKSPRSFE